MLQGTDVETSTEVIAFLLTATHEKKEILLKLKITLKDIQVHSTAAKLTSILLETLNMWNIEKYLIIKLVFDTSSNTGIHKGVTACPEKAFGSFLKLAKTNVINSAFSQQLLCLCL